VQKRQADRLWVDVVSLTIRGLITDQQNCCDEKEKTEKLMWKIDFAILSSLMFRERLRIP
jgi:hypothetical protein